MNGRFHLKLLTKISAKLSYFSKSIAICIGRHPNLLSLKIEEQTRTIIHAASQREYSPLDHVVEAALDASSLADLSDKQFRCLISDRDACSLTELSPNHHRLLRESAARSQLIAFDLSAWGKLRIELGVAPKLLPAPVLQGERRAANTRNVVIFINDGAVAAEMLDDIKFIIAQYAPDIGILVKDNRWGGSASAADWMATELRGAVCHVHIGSPLPWRSYGRLLDSAACQVLQILIATESNYNNSAYSADVPMIEFLDEIHYMRATNPARFGSCFRDLMGDVALREQLISNAVILCRDHNANVGRALVGFCLLGEEEVKS